MSVARCKRETTSSQFIEWRVFLDELPNEFNPLYEYLAQIAAEIKRAWVKQKKKVKRKDFILQFRRVKVQQSAPSKAAIEHSKRSWLGVVMGNFKRMKRLRGKDNGRSGNTRRRT